MIEILQTIRGKEVLFIGSPDIFLLQAFLHGYGEAESRMLQDSPTVVFMKQFQTFVQERYNCCPAGFARIFWFYSTSDDDALRQFWKTVDLFYSTENANILFDSSD